MNREENYQIHPVLPRGKLMAVEDRHDAARGFRPVRHERSRQVGVPSIPFNIARRNV
jgi:hypothetical protein